ncbi:MAG: hypothetical protein ABI586_06950 [Candidatus Nanopelagicales bacterium]
MTVNQLMTGDGSTTDGRTDRVARPRSAAVTLAVLVSSGIASGAVFGLVWLLASPPIWYDVRRAGVFPEPSVEERWFSADAWFLMLGVACGLVLAVIAWVVGRNHPIAALVGLTLGGLIAAATAWLLGGLLGPADPADVIATLDVGSRVEAALGLRAWAVMLAPAMAGVLGFTVAAAALSPKDPAVSP